MKKIIFDNNSEIAVKIGDRMVGIQESESGFDYSIYDMNYKLLDGGVVHNKDKSIDEALNEIIDDLKASKYDATRDIYYRDEIQGNIAINDEPVRIDYEELIEKSAEEEMKKIQGTLDPVMLFRQKTQECFKPIGDLNIDDIEATAAAIVQASLDDMTLHAKVNDAALIGSRARGIETDISDINVVVEYSGDIREESIGSEVTDCFMTLGGYKLVIDPINAEQSGSLTDFLIKEEEYLERKARQRNIELTYQVAECSEFPSFGELHENIKTAQEAMQIYESIPPERMHAIPAISINIHEAGKETYEDDQVEIFVNGRFDLEALEYIPYVLELENTVRAIAELLYINPDAEIIGNIPQMIQTRLDEIKQENMNPIEKLAFDIDNFSRDYDHYGYEDNVVDREENVNNIKISIETGDSGYLKEWLTEVILNSELNDSILCAKQLLARLEHTAKILEYNPIAKVEELEEENYNRIDGVIDTTEKHNKENQKNQHVRVSIKEKLAEKRAEIERKSKRQCECSKEDEPVRL